jgi:hypothetical protein
VTALSFPIDLTPDYLEDHWDDECACTANHLFMGIPCEKSVVALAFACVPVSRVLACSPAVVWIEHEKARGAKCAACGMSAADCWSVIPV